MAGVPRELVDEVSARVGGLAAAARADLEARLSAIDWDSAVRDGEVYDPERFAELREMAIDAMEQVCQRWCAESAVLGADFLDAATGRASVSVADPGRDPEATRGAVKALLDRARRGELDVFASLMLARADEEVRRAENAAVAIAGGTEMNYARVPSGSETCGFCLMLASFGYAYHTREAASHAHPNCDCRVVPEVGDGSIDGYDPSGMYGRYQECLESIGGREGLRAEWDGMPADEREAYVASHGGRAGKAFESYLASRMGREIERRDSGWYRTGRSPEVTFANAALRNEVLSERPWENEAAERLSSLGFKCHFIVDREPYVDPATGLKKFIGLPDLDGGTELKSLRTARGVGAVDRQLRDAAHKKGLRCCVIDNSVGVLPDEDVESAVREKAPKRRVPRVVLIRADGKCVVIET